MASIKPFLDKIRTAVYGKEVRGSLADGLDAVNKETEGATELTADTKRRQDSVEQQFDDLQQNYTEDSPSDAEIVAARTNTETGDNHTTVGRRMDAEYKQVTAQLAETAEEIDNTKEELKNTNNELDNNKARVNVLENKKITQNDVSQEFLEQFVQNTQEINAIPADHSLVQRQFKEPIIIGKRSKNLFNLKYVSLGKYVSHSTGLLQDSPNYAASFPIEVPADTNISISGTTVQFAFYATEEINSYISGVPNGFSNPIRTPENAKYVRLSMLKTEIEKVQLEVGDKPTSYETFDPKVTKDLLGFEIEENAFKHKSILFMGDSITAKEERWVSTFNSIIKPKSYVNVAVSGAHWKDYGNTDYPYDGNPSGGENQHNNVIGNQVQKVVNEDYPAPDIIIIAAGTNDNMNHENVSVESQFTDDGEYIDIEDANRMVFAGAIRWSIETLRNKYLNAQIFIATQIQGNEELRPYAEQDQKVKIVKETANRLSVPVINAFDESGIYGAFENNSADGRYLIDGLHPNENGGFKLGSYIANQILNLYAE